MEPFKAGIHAGGQAGAWPLERQGAPWSSSNASQAKPESKHASGWGFLADLDDLPGLGAPGDLPDDLMAFPYHHAVQRLESPIPHEVVFGWDTLMQEGQALKPLPVRPSTLSASDDGPGRSLHTREVRVGQVKRKREDESLAEPSAQPGAGGGVYSSLALVKPGSGSLGDAVTVLATQILQVGDAGDALAIGHELCKRLGQAHLLDADRDAVIAAVMRGAMERPHAAALLAPVLAGLGAAQSRVNAAAGGLFAHALFNAAMHLSIDPLLAPGMPVPTVQAFEQRSAALKLAVDVVDRRTMGPANVAWVVDRLVQRILETGLPDRAPQPARIAHAAVALSSLGWFFDRERLPGELPSVVRNVALCASATGGDPLPLGAALARAFGATTRREQAIDAAFVNGLARTERLTHLPFNQFLHGYLLPDAGQAQAYDTVLGKVAALAPGLSVLALGRSIHVLALCAAADGHWTAAPGKGASLAAGTPDFGAQVLAALSGLKPAGKVALVFGLRSAISRIATHDKGFAAIQTRLSAELVGRYPKGSLDSQAVLGAMALAVSLPAGLNLMPAAVTSEQRLELGRLLEVTADPQQAATGQQAKATGKEGKGS